MPTPEEYAAAAKRFREQNWQNGGTTVTQTTEGQNLAAIANQQGNTSGAKATPYVAPNGTTDYHITGGSYVAPATGGGGGNPPPVVDTSGAGSGSSGGSQSTDNGIGNAQDYINQLNDLRKNASLSALQKSHDAALSGMGAEKSAIQPKYYDQRNQVAAGAQQQARNFAEFMAQRGGGGTNSGANAQAELNRNSVTQGNLGTLGRQEAQAFTDIERRTSDLNNAYQSDISTTTANAEADKMSALLNDFYVAQQRGDTKAQNAIQNAMQQAQLDMQKAGQTADYTGQFGNTQTLASKAQEFNQTMQTKQLDRSNFESDRSYNLAKSTQEWTQAFQKEQYTDQKAQQIWDNTFKDKSFTQSMNDAAASRGLQWASLNQRDKEFVADSAFREKTFAADQEQRKVDNLKSGASTEINKEIDGLYTGLTSGQISGSAAIQEIDGRVNAGLITKADADRMKSVITTVTASMPNVKPKLTQDQIEANGGSNPQDMNHEQLNKLWGTDPTGKAAGRPQLDWAAWYTDPRGKVGGISYDAWKQAYGPQLVAR